MIPRTILGSLATNRPIDWDRAERQARDPSEAVAQEIPVIPMAELVSGLGANAEAVETHEREAARMRGLAARAQKVGMLTSMFDGVARGHETRALGLADTQEAQVVPQTDRPADRIGREMDARLKPRPPCSWPREALERLLDDVLQPDWRERDGRRLP